MYIFEKIMPLELAMVVVIQFSFQMALLIDGIKQFTIVGLERDRKICPGTGREWNFCPGNETGIEPIALSRPGIEKFENPFPGSRPGIM